MKKITTHKLFAVILFLLFSTGSFAQNNNPWTPFKETNSDKIDVQRQIIPSKYKTFSLDFNQIRPVLENMPMRFSDCCSN